jgi:hypothetical protein
MNKQFEEWLIGEFGFDKIEQMSPKFEAIDFSMQWGVYQLFFWKTKGWWLSIYPYSDKFGGKIEKFWSEGVFNCDFITNVPEQAQKKLIDKAFEIFNFQENE